MYKKLQDHTATPCLLCLQRSPYCFPLGYHFTGEAELSFPPHPQPSAWIKLRCSSQRFMCKACFSLWWYWEWWRPWEVGLRRSSGIALRQIKVVLFGSWLLLMRGWLMKKMSRTDLPYPPVSKFLSWHMVSPLCMTCHHKTTSHNVSQTMGDLYQRPTDRLPGLGLKPPKLRTK